MLQNSKWIIMMIVVFFLHLSFAKKCKYIKLHTRRINYKSLVILHLTAKSVIICNLYMKYFYNVVLTEQLENISSVKMITLNIYYTICLNILSDQLKCSSEILIIPLFSAEHVIWSCILLQFKYIYDKVIS